MVSDWYETFFSWTPTLDHSMRMFISDHRDFSGDHRVAIDGWNIQNIAPSHGLEGSALHITGGIGVNRRSPARFCEISWAVLTYVLWQTKIFSIIANRKNFKKNT